MQHRLRPLVVACLVYGASIPCGADWPQFRGPNRDGKSGETGLLKAWPEAGLERLWVVGGLGTGFSGAAVAQGSLYITGMVGEDHEGVLFAFDLAGNPQWKRAYGPEWSDRYPGTRATPTVDGERIYLLSGTGRLLCFTAATGEVQWSENLVKKFGGIVQPCGFAESVLIEGNKVICTPGGEDACLVALDKSTGETIWTSRGFSQQSAYCSPIVVERGGERWLVTITERSVVGVDMETGRIAWRHPVDPDATDQNHSVSPVYEGGRLYVTSGHGIGGLMLALSPDGRGVEQRWTDETLNCLHGGLVVVDGYVYGANMHGQWVCLELESGKVMYEADGVGMGSVTYADGMLYCYGENGALGLVKASPEGYELSGRIQIEHGEGEHWSHPVIAGGRLYLRHGDALAAYAVTASR